VLLALPRIFCETIERENKTSKFESAFNAVLYVRIIVLLNVVVNVRHTANCTCMGGVAVDTEKNATLSSGSQSSNQRIHSPNLNSFSFNP
jgi:hypothetical protein